MRVFRVTFLNKGKVYEVYARTVLQGELYGFVEIQDLVFEPASRIVVDPGEEKLRGEFKDVHRCLIPIHAVIRIDEVERQGQSRILDLGDKSNIAPFPSSYYAPDKDTDK